MLQLYHAFLLSVDVVCSVRLFKRDDTISDAARNRKLTREYSRTSQLTQHIFWTSVGREGAYQPL